MGFLDDLTKGGAQRAEMSETIKRLTFELMEEREARQSLESKFQKANQARRQAVEDHLGLKDVLAMKQSMFDSMEQSYETSEARINELSARVEEAESKLEAIREEQRLFPLSSKDLLFRYDRLKEHFETMKDSLACPICYEPFMRNSVITLSCGHSFCEKTCWKNWEEKHQEMWKNSPAQGRYPGADCPECRSSGVKAIRIWALEETIRLIERGVKESEVMYEVPVQEKSEVTKEDSSSESEPKETVIDGDLYS